MKYIMSIAIKVENLSKQYRLGQFGTGSLSHDLNRWWHSVRGKENPYLKIGEANDRTEAGNSTYVWSLKDINFEIEQGDAVGIIGRNGAGKSTLLKILSRVTSPTTGRVKAKGRIASLLEVGTGFHPDLSGRENVFLNGAIMGMTKSEIKRKFDEIVDFAGVDHYIDTPVKRYSSGMYIRLAFGVAAHLEPEILIVDEVLAVGDVEFQKKALGKMKDVSNNEGRTVLFVSHNMAAVQKLCTKGILLSHGRNSFVGSIDQIISKYLTADNAGNSVYEIPLPFEHDKLPGYAYQLKVEDISGKPLTEIPVGTPWQIRVKFKLNKAVKHFIIALGISNAIDINLRTTWSNEMDLESGDYEVIFREDHLLFSSGSYHLAIGLSSFERVIHYVENVASIIISDVPDSNLDKSIIRTSGTGFLINPMNVNVSMVK